MGRPVKDLTGKKFGKLRALYDTGERDKHNGCTMWMCICDCGRMRKVRSNHLIFGKIKQCRECASHKHVRGV